MDRRTSVKNVLSSLSFSAWLGSVRKKDIHPLAWLLDHSAPFLGWSYAIDLH